jgi:hypothetical protein
MRLPSSPRGLDLIRAQATEASDHGLVVGRGQAASGMKRISRFQIRLNL